MKRLLWKKNLLGVTAITPHYIYNIEKLDGKGFKKRYCVTVDTQCEAVSERRFFNMWQAKHYCESHWEEFVKKVNGE